MKSSRYDAFFNVVVSLFVVKTISTNGFSILQGKSGSLNPNTTNSTNATYNTHKLEVWFDVFTVTSEDIATVTCPNPKFTLHKQNSQHIPYQLKN